LKFASSLPHEYEWLDFKENWFSKDEIGEYISAISNGAALRLKKLKLRENGLSC